MKLTKNDQKTIGKIQKENCPQCNNKKLLKNDIGQTWCSGVYCRYGFKELRYYFWHKFKEENE